MKKFLLVLLTLATLSSCDDLMTHDVSDVLDMDPRELEDIKSLRVRGIMGNSMNLGMLNINAFALRDIEDEDQIFYVHTTHKTLPADEGEKITLTVKLWKEIDLGFSKFYLMEEITE